MANCLIVLALLAASSALAQQASLIDAPAARMPGVADSNSPGYWRDGGFVLFNSVALPVRSEGYDPFSLGFSRAVLFDDYQTRQWRWIEAVWVDPDGTVFAWYHHEPGAVCEEKPLTAPQIGALYSTDNGLSFIDLGIVLADGFAPDCDAVNGYFAGGHGDFSVIPDRKKEYFYFVFSNYGGGASSQGIALARMPYAKRRDPVGEVWKYFQGEWKEPGVGGAVTPIFPAAASWALPETDAFWGPSIHWNTHLERYVVLMNRSCCEPGWPAEGIYMTTNADLANIAGWTPPQRLLANAGWYPQVLGTGEGESDTLAGETARLYVGGESRWEIRFRKDPVAGGAAVPAALPVAKGQRLYRERYGRTPGRFNRTR